MLGHGEVAPRPRTCCGQSRGRESRSSWFLAQGFPSPSSPSGTFGMGRVFSLFHQLNNSLSAVSSRGESQGSQPPIPSLPREAASGTFPGWLEETPLSAPVLAPAAAAAPGMPNSVPEQVLQPSQGSQSSAPGFLFPGTTGTCTGFAAPRKKPE